MTELEYKRKRRTKLVWTILIAVVLLVITMIGALAYSLDNYEDKFNVKKGDVVQGSFVIQDYVQGTILKSNMEWVSLDKDKYISEKVGMGYLVVDNNYVFYYWVNVPKDSDIGIYRGIIEIKSGTDTKILNIKIDVENNVVNGISQTLKNPNARWPIIAIIIFILMLLMLISYLRAKPR